LDIKRRAEVQRRTRETDIALELQLDGSGQYDISTEIGMLDHLLESLARHARFDLRVQATGDIERDPHHLVEDVGLVLGEALNEALGKRSGITRFGHAVVPMDEALALVSVDLSGRAYAAVDITFGRQMIGQLPSENIPHFLEAFAQEGRLNLHVRLITGDNDHHIAEAAFKGLARSLRGAVAIDSDLGGEVPSTKEVL
jgi:imidazoleglycerol-phosphate dehydratase